MRSPTHPGLTEAFHSEELIRLDGCFLCYRPPDDSPPVSRLPAATTGRISFGSFNNLAKLNAALIAQWAAILVEVPNSRLVLKSKPFADQGAREFVSGLFRKTGIAAERIVFFRLGSQHPKSSRALRRNRHRPGYLSLQRCNHDLRMPLDGCSGDHLRGSNTRLARRSKSADGHWA
jgi:predicted O-linked N-acetylglucosamine transferase (SPINDLY family)